MLEAHPVGKADKKKLVSSASVLALDLGASSGRAIVGTFSAESGLMLSEVHRFDNGAIPESLPMQWDLAHLVQELKTGIARACDAAPIQSIAIDTWGVDFGLLDSKGAPIANPVHYRDARTDSLVARLQNEGKLDGVYAATGTQTMDINTLFQLIALKRDDPHTVERVERLLFMPDLLAYCLTGNGGCDPSIASTSQLMDAKTGTWSSGVVERFGIPRQWLPAITPEGTVIGDTLPGVAPRPIPVVRVCGHDTASAVASIPLGADDCFISCGTWSLVGAVLDAPVLSPEAEALNVTNELGAQGKTLFLENCTGLWIAQELRRELVKSYGAAPSWIKIAQLASAAEPFTCLIDTEAPEFAKPGNMRDRIAAFAHKTGQTAPARGDIGALYRCVYESLALRYCRAIAEIERLTGRTYRSIHVIGGGAQNRCLCQTIADITQLPVVAGPFEATAIGNILVQLVTAGVFADLDEARAAIAESVEQMKYIPGVAPSQEVLNRYEALGA